MSKKLRRTVLPIAAAVVGNLVAPGIGSALGSTLSAGTLGSIGAAVGGGAANYSQNHNIGQALAAAGGSYIGGQLGGSALGNTGGTIGNAVNSTFGSELGNIIGPTLGSNIVGANLGSTVGNYLGSSIGGDLASSLVGSAKNASPQGEGAAPQFKPSQEPEMATLPNFAGMSPLQQSTNIATGGVYGGGQGPDEQNYFLNLINRRLVDPSGNVDKDLSELKPVESSYLDQLGLGGYGNATSLLEAISKRRKAA